MSVIEVKEELVTDIDMNAEFTNKGLSVSIYVDDVEFKKCVDYEMMAFIMLEDSDKYDDERLTYLIHQLRLMANTLEEGIDGREQ
jgi:hypothetical protein